MTFITRSALQSYGQISERLEKALRNEAKTRSASTRSVFLSHSHHDQDLIWSAKKFLENQDVVIYVDWLDQGMPEKTNAMTAARIKEAIRLNGKFILLATERSLASRWVPWELGCADGIKGLEHMAIFPVKEDRLAFPGNEYVSLYSTIEQADNGTWGVFPAGENQGESLAQWFRS